MTWSSSRGATSELHGERVLVVDDEAIIALDVATQLNDAGAEVIGPCSNLASAMAMARREELTAAVLDVRLGRENVQPLAELLTGAAVPFLFYSGQFNFDDMRRQWPACAFLAKPAPARALVRAVRSLLEARLPGPSSPVAH